MAARQYKSKRAGLDRLDNGESAILGSFPPNH
jgi:hypothetical protein